MRPLKVAKPEPLTTRKREFLNCLILKKHVERTVKELVAEVYPADRPYHDVAGSTTLVSDMSLSLADNASVGEMKNAQGIPRRPQA